MRSSGREEIAEVLSEEEYACMLQVKNLKREYRDLFQEMKAARSEAAYTERLIEQCKTTLVLEFESWYKREYGGSIGGLAPFLDEGGHASPGALSRGVLLDSLESVPSSPAKTLESDEKSERLETDSQSRVAVSRKRPRAARGGEDGDERARDLGAVRLGGLLRGVLQRAEQQSRAGRAQGGDAAGAEDSRAERATVCAEKGVTGFGRVR
jgi:hypothetical protein